MGLVLIFYIFKNLFIYLLSIISNFFSHLVYINIARQMFVNYLKQPYKFHLKQNLANLIRNVTDEVYVFHNAIDHLILLLTEIFVVAAIILLILYFEPQATIILLITFIIIGSIFFYLSKKYYTEWVNKEL